MSFYESSEPETKGKIMESDTLSREKRQGILSTIIVGFSLMAASLHGFAYELPENKRQGYQSDNIEVLQKISKGVSNISKHSKQALVFISVSKKMKRPNHPHGRDPYEFFFGPQFRGRQRGRERMPTQHSLGSGFFVDLKKGYILTNNHVVADADEINVKLANEKEYKAKVVGRDPNTDIAIIKVKGDFERKGLMALSLGNSDSLEVGHFVVALGSPFGLEASLSFGVVSAIGRGNLKITKLGNFIQTDAAINPGNSGGPLINMKGEVVGINTAIFSKSGGYNGIGFTVPANLARQIATRLINEGSVQRGYLGIGLQKLTPDLLKSLGLPKGIKGIIVSQIVNEGPAAVAGIVEGDVIISVNGGPIKNESDLINVIGLKKPGSKVKIVLFRKGKQKVKKVVLGNWPGAPRVASGGFEGEKESSNQFGLRVSPLNHRIKNQFRIEGDEGVVISSIKPDSPAEKSSLRIGDRIVKVNGKKVTSVRQFQKLLKSGKRSLIYIERSGQLFFVSLIS